MPYTLKCSFHFFFALSWDHVFLYLRYCTFHLKYSKCGGNIICLLNRFPNAVCDEIKCNSNKPLPSKGLLTQRIWVYEHETNEHRSKLFDLSNGHSLYGKTALPFPFAESRSCIARASNRSGWIKKNVDSAEHSFIGYPLLDMISTKLDEWYL